MTIDNRDIHFFQIEILVSHITSILVIDDKKFRSNMVNFMLEFKTVDPLILLNFDKELLHFLKKKT